MFRRGVLGYLPVNVAQAVAGFGAIVVFTRLLSPADYGDYALGFSVGGLVYTCLFTGTEAAMARFHAAEEQGGDLARLHGTLRRAFLVAAVLTPLVTAAAVLLLPLSAGLRGAVAAGVGSTVTRSLLKLGQERRRAAGEVAGYAVYDIAQTLGAVGLGIAFALLGLGGAAPLLGAGVASAVLAAIALPRELEAARGGRFDRERFARYAAYALPVSLSLVMALVLATTDRFVLAAFTDARTVGAYHAGYSLSNRTLDILFIWLGMAGGPAAVAAFERGGEAALHKAAAPQAELMAFLAIPAAAGLALVARPLVELMVGPELRDGAARVTPWIAAGGLMGGATTYYLHTAFTLSRRTGRLLIAMAIPAGANLALNLVLTPRFGHRRELCAGPRRLRGAGPRGAAAAGPVVGAGPLRTGGGGDDAGGAAAARLRRRGRAGAQGGGGRGGVRGGRRPAGRLGRALPRRGDAAGLAGAHRMTAVETPNARWAAARPRLSVLVPFFRDDPRPLLADLAGEAQALEGAAEVVVLDDAGGDPARSAGAAHAVGASPLPAVLLASGVNEGRARGRNRLAAAARGRHLLFVDADMRPGAPGFLRTWLDLVEAADPPAAFGGFTVPLGPPAREHKLHHALQAGAECLSAAERARNPAKHVFTSNLLVRRDVLEAEPFDERFAGWGWEDVEWGARAAARFGVTHIDNPAVHLGLDTAAALAAKYEQSPANFARLLQLHPDLVRAFPSYRAARWLRRTPARATVRKALRALVLADAAPLRARAAAMRLYKAALYAEVVG